MKRNATRREKRMTLRARGRRACACMLSLVLAIGLVPSFGIAEVAQGEAGVAANVASASDDAANTEAVGMANGTDAPDSQKVAIPESSTAIDAAVIFEGNEPGAASDKNGEEAGFDSAPSAARDAASAQGSSASASADAAAAQDDAATPADDPEVGPNPFKQGMDAQSLLGLDNYDKHVMVDSEGNVDKTETAKRWKTKVGCEGKKMWAGTLIQDNGYWDQPGWSFAVDWPQPNPLHDAEVYAYIEKTTAVQLTARSATWLLPRAMLVLRPSTSVICLTAAMMCTLATSASNTIALARFQSPASSKRSTWMRLCRMAQMRL